jgi:hypothetical protein
MAQDFDLTVAGDFTFTGDGGERRFTRGDAITDAATVAAILGSEQHVHVTKVAHGTHSRPQEASESADVFIREAPMNRAAAEPADPATLAGRDPRAEDPSAPVPSANNPTVTSVPNAGGEGGAAPSPMAAPAQSDTPTPAEPRKGAGKK